MDIERRSPKGVRGWSVRQKVGALRAGRPRDDRPLREFLATHQRFLFRTAAVLLLVWAGGTLLAGKNGFLRLQTLKTEERALAQENAKLAREHDEAQHQINEDQALARERVLREEFRKSKPNEIVIYAVTGSAEDSLAGGGMGGYGPANAQGPAAADDTGAARRAAVAGGPAGDGEATGAGDRPGADDWPGAADPSEAAPGEEDSGSGAGCEGQLPEGPSGR